MTADTDPYTEIFTKTIDMLTVTVDTSISMAQKGRCPPRKCHFVITESRSAYICVRCGAPKPRRKMRRESAGIGKYGRP